MLPSDLAHLSVRNICDLYASGSFPEEFKNLTLRDLITEAVRGEESGQPSVVEEQHIVDSRQPSLEAGQTGPEEVQTGPESGRMSLETDRVQIQVKKVQWREKVPNCNNTNVPLFLWRGD